ncbi:MAG: NosD domain-containing protein, partial [Candidatus Aenigmatarchaeota archaeon]
ESTCINIIVSDVILDGAGHWINRTGSSRDPSGIYVFNSIIVLTNVTIKNVNIANWTYGIYLRASSNNILTNNTANSNYIGIHLYASSDNTLTNNTANSNYIGIHLYASSDNTLTNNIANSNSYGIYLYSSSNKNIYNNFFNNTNNVNIGGTSSSSWNTTKTLGTNIVGGNYIGGNFWATPDGTGFSETCNDTDYDGICDSSYILATNNIDYLPLTFIPTTCFCNSCSECIDKLNNAFCTEVKLTTDITDYNGICIYNPENFTNKIFDCQGHIIDGIGQLEAIALADKTDNIIKNCIISDFTHGIYLINANNTTITNNSIYNVYSAGIKIENGMSNNITNNNVSGYLNSTNCIYFLGGSNNNINNNIITQCYNGIFSDNSNNNIFNSNIVYSNNYSGYFMQSSHNNYFFNETIKDSLNSDGSGIYFYYSNNNTIENSNINGNRNNIRTSLSSLNTTIINTELDEKILYSVNIQALSPIKIINSIIKDIYNTIFSLNTLNTNYYIYFLQIQDTTELNNIFLNNKQYAFINKSVIFSGINDNQGIELKISYNDTNFYNHEFDNELRMFRLVKNTNTIEYINSISNTTSKEVIANLVPTSTASYYFIAFKDSIAPTIFENDNTTFYPTSDKRSIVYPGLDYVHWFNVSVNDTSDFGKGKINNVILEFAGHNFTAQYDSSRNVYYVTLSGLGIGEYNYKWYATDILNNTATSSTYTYRIIQPGSSGGGGGGGIGVIQQLVNVTSSVCGNGICEENETETCPQDCLSQATEYPIFGNISLIIATITIAYILYEYTKIKKQKKKRTFTEKSISGR